MNSSSTRWPTGHLGAAGEGDDAHLDVLGQLVQECSCRFLRGDHARRLDVIDAHAPRRVDRGPPPHSHPWDESFYVTRGSVLFSAGGADHTASPGTLVYVPAGTEHAFRFGAGGDGMVEFSGAGGQATRLFSSLAQEVPEGAANLPNLLGVMQRHGVAVAV